MAAHSVTLRLDDIFEAIRRIREALGDASPEAFEADWQRLWLVERGTEIISEASRHLPPELKARHSGIPWQRVAGIGNILRHDYRNIAPDVLWALARDHWSRSNAPAWPNSRARSATGRPEAAGLRSPSSPAARPISARL